MPLRPLFQSPAAVDSDLRYFSFGCDWPPFVANSRAHLPKVLMSFSTLGLSEALMRAVADEGYTKPTPIQAQAIPAVLAGGDLLAGAQTGTGKTAGFVLPMLQRLSTRPSPYAA